MNLKSKMNKPIGMTNKGRKAYRSKSGEIYSEKTIGIQDEGINRGRQTNIPTVFGGKQVSPKEAISRVRKYSRGKVIARDPETNEPLPSFRSIKDADKAAKRRSKSIRLISPIGGK